MASYFDLLECQRRKGMPREGRVMMANAIQSSYEKKVIQVLNIFCYG